MPVVISKTWHKFGPKIYKKGDKFTVTDAEAKTLAARGWVKVEKPVEPPKLKRTYKRKDIQTAAPLMAEPPAIVPEDVPEVPAFRWPTSQDDE